MSTEANPVRNALAALQDGTLAIRPGYGAQPQNVQVKAGPKGALQAFYSYTAPEEADLQMANTAEVATNTAGIASLTETVDGLGSKVDEQTAATKANTSKLGDLGGKLDTVATREQATVDKLTDLAALTQQTLTAQRNAAQSTAFWQARWPLSNGGDVDLGAVAQADRIVYGLGPSSGSSLLVALLASLVGGMADVQLFHVDPAGTSAEKAFGGAKATNLGDPISLGPNQPLVWMAFGLTLSAGRQLRAHSNAGNVRLNVRVA